ncbi:MAG: hypothetical protein KAI39_12780 [Desulfobulbaceae bacterium]|nr:hypothetical protein [Desulfobulbaceae bacterium]
MEETSWFSTIIGNPFYRGMLIGLVIGVFLWFRSLFKIQQLSRDIKKLRDHLHTKFEIDSADNQRRKEDADKLKEERDNLRNMIQVLNQKAGKQEIRQTQVYQKAIEIMFEKSPGFAPAWQITLKDAEEEMRKAERGILPFFKRMTSSTPTTSSEKGNSHKKPLELEDPGN